MTAVESPAAAFTRAYIEDTRQRCAIDALMTTLECAGYMTTAAGLRRGPVAKSGARSHVAWRLILAGRYDCSARLAGLAAAQYAAIACDTRGDRDTTETP